ncbi:MAG: alkaline phosphatase D [Marinoscillum sp.]|jgi:alkaline phosphatase D
MDRRLFIKAITAASLSIPILTACGGASSKAGAIDNNSPSTPDLTSPLSSGVEFLHGVACGDPLDDRIIFWTRATPPEGFFDSVTVLCEIAEDPLFENLVLSEFLTTDSDSDYTVKFDGIGLAADRRYWYRFKSADAESVTGRARTLPSPGVSTDRLRFAVCSCSSYPHGYFSVYRMIANRSDLDFVLHLGDYIYEYGQGEYGDNPGRLVPENETVTLADYRSRYALYHLDVDLQAAHAQHAFITVWDDHETCDNSYRDGALNHNEDEGEGDWFTRKQEAVQAYFEWLPIRPPTLSKDSIYRAFQFGDLADFIMLDTRLEGREQQLENPADPARTEQRNLLGQTQKDWFKNELDISTGLWKFVGQQVMIAQLQILEIQRLLPDVPTNDFSPLIAVNMDQWDGYPTEREEILDFIETKEIKNTVVLTGDIHSSWASEVYKSSALVTSGLLEEPLAAEFVTTSITSPGFPPESDALLSRGLKVANPHIKYTELSSRGFILMDVTRERTQAEYYYAADISTAEQSGVESDDKIKTVEVRNGSSRLFEDGEVSQPRS